MKFKVLLGEVKNKSQIVALEPKDTNLYERCIHIAKARFRFKDSGGITRVSDTRAKLAADKEYDRLGGQWIAEIEIPEIYG
jgi:hypothetical protein